MASNILLKVIIHFNVAAAWPGEGCGSSSFCLSLDTKKLPVSPRWLTTTCSVFSTAAKGRKAPLSPANWTKESRLYTRPLWKLSAHYMVSRNNNVPTQSCHALFLEKNPSNTALIPCFILQSWEISASMKRKDIFDTHTFRKMDILCQSKTTSTWFDFCPRISPFVKEKMECALSDNERYSCPMKVWY